MSGSLGDGDDCAPIVFKSITTPTARKEHRCTDCARSILPGEQYEYCAFKRYCDDLRIEKRCAECIRPMTNPILRMTQKNMNKL